MNKRNASIILSVILVAGGIFFALFTYWLLMWAVWGAPTHLLQYVALLSAIGLLISGLISFGSMQTGRILALVSLFGLGLFYIPATQSLVPAHMRNVSLLNHLIIGTYFALLAVGLFYPAKFRLSGVVFSVAIFAALGFAGYRFYERLSDGEYVRPTITFYKWNDNPSDRLVIGHDPAGFLSGLTGLIEKAGIHGTLDWNGRSGYADNEYKMFIIAKSQLQERVDLPYSKDKKVLHVFDGTHWFSLPKDSEFFNSTITLEPEGNRTGYWQTHASGGSSGGTAFSW